MPTDDPIRDRLFRIVALIRGSDLLAASREIDVLDRDLYGPLIGGRGALRDPDRSVSVSGLLERASTKTALDAEDSHGALICLERALNAWTRGRLATVSGIVKE